MMITASQIRIGRASLGWSLAKLADKAGVATNSVVAAERGADCRMSTVRALAETMADAGIIFFSDGTCGQKMFWPHGRPTDPRVVEATLTIINANQRANGRCDYVDEE